MTDAPNAPKDAELSRPSNLSALLARYGMAGVLLLLCVFFTWATFHEEKPTGRSGAEAVFRTLRAADRQTRVVVVGQADAEEVEFADTLQALLKEAGYTQVRAIKGDPPTVRQALEQTAQAEGAVDLIVTTPACRQWTLFDALKANNPGFTRTRIEIPPTGKTSVFLSANNLRNVSDQTAVIAIIAIGMTMVILTGGIDLSVGSLIALSAVVTAWLIRAWGGTSASGGTMLAASLVAIAVCGLVGLFSGLMITQFKIPPFIATLAMMQVASGAAFIVAQGQSINAIPASFIWLGRGANLASLPNSVVLMLLLYVAAHIFMNRTRSGRYIYAVGGNPEASRLSGIRTKRTLLFVYVVSGLCAGLGGVITASQLNAGSPTYGQAYELYVIASVVVGGTSLVGGEGFIFGTLIGAFIIAVIRNGMNLTNVEPYTQKVALGLVILGAVLLDRLRRASVRK
jgi:ribose transport system permease protein